MFILLPDLKVGLRKADALGTEFGGLNGFRLVVFFFITDFSDGCNSSCLMFSEDIFILGFFISAWSGLVSTLKAVTKIKILAK